MHELHQSNGFCIGWRRRGVSREIIRPFSSLVDPCFYDFDLLLAKRSGKRHLRAEPASDQFLVELAPSAVSWRDHHHRAAPHRISSAVKPEPMHLLRWPVTLNAILLEKRLNIVPE